MHRLLRHLLLATMILVPATAADAATISVFRSFSVTGTDPLDSIAPEPFDASLGTLDSVDVNVTGVLNLQATLQALGFFTQHGVFIPVPYDFTIEVLQRFLGIGGYFTFDTPATFRFAGTSTGLATNLLVTANYSYSFEFNAITDLVGGFALFNPSMTTTAVGPVAFTSALIPPLNGAEARRSDFDDVPFAPLQIDFLQQVQTSSTGPLPIITFVQDAGLLELRYNYTPAADPVPEPASLMLLGGGLLGLAARSRRRP